MKFVVRKAERKKAKLRLALSGVSGSGKSVGAITLALGMKKKFVVIDTENTSADLYAHLGEFDVLELQKPFSPERYISAIKTCEDLGYDLIVIDSLSHAWVGEGGVLDMQSNATKASSNKNSYTAWRDVTPWHNKLIDTMLQSKCDLIITMRSKTHYEIVGESGKMKPVKIGLAPIQREGMDYEFTVVLEIDKESHLYTASKDRTQLFDGKHEAITLETGKKLMEWLNSGVEVSEEIKSESPNLDEIKYNLAHATLEKLNEEYRSAIKLFPDLTEEFIKIAAYRKESLRNGVDH